MPNWHIYKKWEFERFVLHLDGGFVEWAYVRRFKNWRLTQLQVVRPIG